MGKIVSRQNLTLRKACNQLLDSLAGQQPGAVLGSEQALAGALGASRTTVRAVLARLAELGVIAWEGRDKRLVRAPAPGDRYPEEELRDPAATLQHRVLDWLMRDDPEPGSQLSETDLARRLEVPVAAVRDVLQGIAPLGLIEKKPNRHWILRGFTRDFATEMFDIREMIELKAMARLVGGPMPPRLLAGLRAMEREHIALMAREDAALAAFPALDARFHELLIGAAGNRFFDDFAQRIAIIVHYHYQWNKRDETERNRAALAEHLAILRAAISGDAAGAVHALEAHLATARTTLMTSVNWK